jgi:hypothetical protein
LFLRLIFYAILIFCFSDALSEACDRRKLELNSLDAFLDTGKKALQLSGTDTQSLGGRHLIICGNKAFVQIIWLRRALSGIKSGLVRAPKAAGFSDFRLK